MGVGGGVGGGGGRTGERGMSGKGTSKRAESRRLIKRNYATILHISQSKKGILLKLTLMKIVHLCGLISVVKVSSFALVIVMLLCYFAT